MLLNRLLGVLFPARFLWHMLINSSFLQSSLSVNFNGYSDLKGLLFARGP